MIEDSPVRSPKVRNVLIAAIVTLLLVFSLAYYARIGPLRSNSESTTSESTQTSLDTTFTTYFHYPISINYSGSWNLVYWGENGTVPQNSSTIPGRNPAYVPWQYNVKGNLTGSGNYRTAITTYGVGYVENMLCAKATKLDSQSLTLTLTVVGTTNSTTASNPSAEVCVTYGV
jgi:hypothetical protein